MSSILGPHGGRVLSASGVLQTLLSDTFTDDDKELSLHTADSGHAISQVHGAINIVGNEADVVDAPGGWVHYGWDLSAEAKAPREVIFSQTLLL